MKNFRTQNLDPSFVRRKLDVAKSVMFLAHEVERLKIIKRHGITSDGNHESVADHSWRVSFLLILFTPFVDENFNVERALKMALIHDIVEVYAGDAHYLNMENENQKNLQKIKEFEAIKRIKDLLPEKIGQDIYQIWVEFENQETYEAKLVKAIDKVEAFIQQNEADISTWTKAELESVFYYLDDYCSFDSFLCCCKEVVISESIKKIKASESIR